MKLISLITFCALVAMFSIGCTQSAPTNSPSPSAAASPRPVTPKATPDELAAARGIFVKDCENCHGETGEGGLVKVENKRLKVPSFKSDRALKLKDEDFTKQINNGGEGMPAFKDKLKPEEIAMMVKFVRKEFQGK